MADASTSVPPGTPLLDQLLRLPILHDPTPDVPTQPAQSHFRRNEYHQLRRFEHTSDPVILGQLFGRQDQMDLVDAEPALFCGDYNPMGPRAEFASVPAGPAAVMAAG